MNFPISNKIIPSIYHGNFNNPSTFIDLSCNLTTIFVITSLIVIFLLQVFSIIKMYTCNHTFVDIFISNFIHVDFLHLVSNITTLIYLSTIEQEIGSLHFTYLIIASLIMNTILESTIHRLFKTKCSVGFSGILYSIIVFDIIYKREVDVFILFAFFTQLFISNTSITGHLIGCVSGLITGYLFSYYLK